MPTLASKTLALPRMTHGAPDGLVQGGAGDEDRREQVGVVAAGERVVDDDALAAEDVDRLAVEAEENAVHRRELGERVDDLGEARLHGGAAAAGLELRGQVDGGDAVGDREPEELRSFRDRGAEPVAVLEGVGALEQRVDRGGSDALCGGSVR